MLNLVFSQYKPGGPGRISTAFNMMLPKLYAISMMWTLNARRGIRMADSKRRLKNSSNGSSGSRSRGPRRVTVSVLDRDMGLACASHTSSYRTAT
jgi:hypothetical protein